MRDDLLSRQRLADIERMIFPPVILGHGYMIPDMRPGGVNFWRKLGDTSRPLRDLVALENKIAL
jgi:hypothetical protein